MCGVTEPEAEGYLLHRDASCAQKQSGLLDSPALMVSLWRDLVGLEIQAVNLRDSQPGDPLQIFRWIGVRRVRILSSAARRVHGARTSFLPKSCRENNGKAEAVLLNEGYPSMRTSKTAAGALPCLDGISKRRQSVEMPPSKAMTLRA